MELTQERECKYCKTALTVCEDEGLECNNCKMSIHLKCLKRGSVPGGLQGDVFYELICKECSTDGNENFTRIRISWLQIICLVLYHLQNRSPGLARKGFFHWRHHIATFIDRNWDTIFPSDVKKKKKWMGTIAGTLSHFNGYIFLSGTAIFNEPAWWTLSHPKLSPQGISITYSKLLVQKQVLKTSKEKCPPDAELYESILPTIVKDEEYLQLFTLKENISTDPVADKNEFVVKRFSDDSSKKINNPKSFFNKRKHPLSSLGNTKKIMKALISDSFSSNLGITQKAEDSVNTSDLNTSTNSNENISLSKENEKLLDPFCHYNTSLNSISKLRGLALQVKLTGGVHQDLIFSPYSQIYLKPYIRRDTEAFPCWLKLMAELQFVINSKNEDYELPTRAPLDYTYVQPEHIPAINSMCNQFFWPGIDLTESLQYPDFSCVVLYKRLIVAFAFVVPNVTHTENYLSFIFTRPHWRNCGIAKFMIYHLIQTSLGKDITLHVSIDNPALFLYQKFGFKVENVALDFYDKYYRDNIKGSKHAFLCRLER